MADPTNVLVSAAFAGAVTVALLRPVPAGATIRIGTRDRGEEVSVDPTVPVGPPYVYWLASTLAMAHPAGTPVHVREGR